MKSIEQFGKPMIDYEGVAEAEFKDNNTALSFKGYFQAAQFDSGRLAISLVPTDVQRPRRMTIGGDTNPQLSFQGQDLNGWELETIEPLFFSRLSWLLAPIAEHPSHLDFGAGYILAKQKTTANNTYRKAKFVLSNFLWHDNQDDEPEPLTLCVNGLRVAIDPLEEYSNIARRLVQTKGIEPTASLCIEKLDGSEAQLFEFKEDLEELLVPLRLVTGNFVDWYFGEGTSERDGKTIARIHKYVATNRYSNTVTFRPTRSSQISLVPKLDLNELIEAYFDPRNQGLDHATLRELIHYFTNACDDSSFLESRGLLASTLTELISAKYAAVTTMSEFIPKPVFDVRIRPSVVSTINATELIGKHKQHLTNQLQGAFRTTFRQKLRNMVSEVGLTLNRDEVSRIVNIRNHLVHEGTYRSDFESGSWYEDYQFMIWINFIALCRLSGYKGDLPEYPSGRLFTV